LFPYTTLFRSPGFPNLFCLYGPNTNIVINGSIIYFSECGVRYILGLIEHLLRSGARAIDVKREVHDAFNEAVDAENRRMAWGASTVNSWYKNRFGRVSQNWPFTLLEYWQRTLRPDPAEYELLGRADGQRAARPSPRSREAPPLFQRGTGPHRDRGQVAGPLVLDPHRRLLLVGQHRQADPAVVGRVMLGRDDPPRTAGGVRVHVDRERLVAHVHPLHGRLDLCSARGLSDREREQKRGRGQGLHPLASTFVRSR